MIRHPLALRLDAERTIREQIHEAARLGARGIVVDAIGDLAPHRLSETGRRELRHVLRTVGITLVGLSLPTRRPFDTTDELDARIRRADSAFAMAYELGTSLVLVRAGQVPDQEAASRREVFLSALTSLARRADHRGVRLALETSTDSGEQLRDLLVGLNDPCLAASIDPTSLLRAGLDPLATTRELNTWIAHAYAPSTVRVSSSASNARGLSTAIDWEEYLGALEEVGYRGFLTIWPDPSQTASEAFSQVSRRLEQLS